MHTIYLTGGIGAGKSTVLARLRGRGAVTHDLDGISHEILHNIEVKQQLRSAFGTGIFDDVTTEVDRHALAQYAFANSESTRILDDITHPAILKRLAEVLAQDASQGAELAAVEVQIAEAADARMADEVMTLVCPREVRRERVQARGMAPEDFDARDAAQIGDTWRCALADTVIDTSSTPADVAAAVDSWFDERKRADWRLDTQPIPQPHPPVQPQGLSSPTIAFVGRHNSGKTTLVVQVISELVRRGLDVGSVKHHGHTGFTIDVEGKDSWRHRQAGASEVAICAPDQFALVRDLTQEMSAEECVQRMQPHDVVIVEGYRRSSIPEIEVMRAANERDRAVAEAFIAAHRPDLALPGWLAVEKPGRDAERMPGGATAAVVTDIPRAARTARACGIRAYHLDDIDGICDFIQEQVVRH